MFIFYFIAIWNVFWLKNRQNEKENEKFVYSQVIPWNAK